MATADDSLPIDEGDRHEREASAERGEGRRVDPALAGCLVFAAVIVLPVFLYFGFFAAVLIDELVLGTHWFADVLPEPALEALRVIYAPLLWLLDQFDG